jgi:hypothetical protein
MPHHILKLIEEGEHQLLDFKFEIADSHKIARTLAAFANTDGGRLLVGVKDNGALAGVRSEEEYFMVEAAANMYCDPPVPFRVKQWTLQKKTILEVIVQKSDQRPHYAQQSDGSWKAYRRVGDQNFPVGRLLLRVWKLQGKPAGVFLKFTDPERFLLSYLETHDTLTQAGFARMAGITMRQAENILVRFMLLRMITMEETENHTWFRKSDQTTEGV